MLTAWLDNYHTSFTFMLFTLRNFIRPCTIFIAYQDIIKFVHRFVPLITLEFSYGVSQVIRYWPNKSEMTVVRVIQWWAWSSWNSKQMC